MTVTENHASFGCWAPAYDVPPSWHRYAACKGQTHLFFSDASEAAAKAVCATCPVVDVCLTEALTRNDPWVLGGMNYFQRKRERTRRNKATA